VASGPGIIGGSRVSVPPPHFKLLAFITRRQASGLDRAVTSFIGGDSETYVDVHSRTCKSETAARINREAGVYGATAGR
jgi:hypothetical protein